MPEDYFGERVAERFDDRYADLADPAVVDPIVDFIADLAGGGSALEFGIGTGRIALPLAERGVRVHGTTIEARFSVAYLVANTIMNLTTQDEQVACFRNAAAHLEPHGRFVIEVLVPRIASIQ
jgi:hypothetical protein